SIQHPSELLLYSLTGEKLLQIHLSQGTNSLNLQDYPSGIYIIKLVPEGYPTEVYKLIIR
ncbi:T9SS type A sorting domain-containing protein, partial [Pseudomonas sp. Kh14]|uniref:T9SS type A sorting domain-containing protein n=1 Tax=Pseudomonas sp. Kh14 TaxID=2093745 RepID=UPI001182FBE7